MCGRYKIRSWFWTKSWIQGHSWQQSHLQELLELPSSERLRATAPLEIGRRRKETVQKPFRPVKWTRYQQSYTEDFWENILPSTVLHKCSNAATTGDARKMTLKLGANTFQHTERGNRCLIIAMHYFIKRPVVCTVCNQQHITWWQLLLPLRSAGKCTWTRGVTSRLDTCWRICRE
jgi:putative SOS response-associated peptidase YedK